SYTFTKRGSCYPACSSIAAWTEPTPPSTSKGAFAPSCLFKPDRSQSSLLPRSIPLPRPPRLSLLYRVTVRPLQKYHRHNTPKFPHHPSRIDGHRYHRRSSSRFILAPIKRNRKRFGFKPRLISRRQ